MLGVTLTAAENTQSLQALENLKKHDTTYWLFRINEASIIGNIGKGLLDKKLGITIRDTLCAMEYDADNGRWIRPELYITFEPELLKRCGVQASVLHVGRSSQDILATTNFAQMREALLAIADSTVDLVKTFCNKADQYWDTIVPFYTNGVQAQPGRYSHYLFAQAISWGRELDRLFECLNRYNRSPMGSCVLNGSPWSLDQDYTAKVLGFNCVAENAFEANQLASNDFPLEASQVIQAMMIKITNFLQDFMVQYAQPRPWIQLVKAGSTYISSAMPQKRNPGLINNCRRNTAIVISESQNVLLRIHNLNEGMPDARDNEINLEWLCDVLNVIETFKGIVGGMQVSRERALEELDQDWTCTQNIADMMMLKAGVPFRLGHHFASHLVTWARANNKTPSNVTYAEICEQWEIFKTKGEGVEGNFPLPEVELRAAMNPAGIVEARVSFGGPQESDMQRQKANLKTWIQEHENQTEKIRAQIAEGLQKLSDDLKALV